MGTPRVHFVMRPLPSYRIPRSSLLLVGLLWIASLGLAADLSEMARALTFHASFDHGVDADFARGDRRFLHAPSYDKRAESKPGLPPDGEVRVAEGVGRFGNALRFVKTSTLACFRTSENMAYRKTGWNGTVSFWLSVEPEADLPMGFCDPLQITSKAWNDAAFFVEFEKKTNGVPFRIGVYPDPAVWNPRNGKWEDMSPAEKPHVTVPEPTPFARGRWTHVVFTFEHFNTGRSDGVVTLYLDGRKAAQIPARQQTFTWDLDKSYIMMGIGYLGLWDELAIFNRALTAEEVGRLYALPTGVAGLHR